MSYDNNVYRNGKRDTKLEQECFVNMSQASSCDYSLSQFRADESAFHIKAEVDDDEDSQFNSYVNNRVQDDTKKLSAPAAVLVAAAGTAEDEDVDIDNNADDDDEEDIPIAVRQKIKREISDDEDDVPLTARKKIKTEKKAKKKKRDQSDDDEAQDDYDEKPKKKKVKKEKVI